MQNEAATAIFLQPTTGIPNNQKLPLLLYRQVFKESTNLGHQFREAFKQNNWSGTWANGVFSYHHHHSRAHEVLGVAAGSAVLIFGGPGGKEIEVKAGDMAVLPAGTGHCRKSASSDFNVIGAYPKGQEAYDTCTEKDDAEEKKKNIAAVALPTADPVYGQNGPLVQQWSFRSDR